ncbi:hypothetical protein GW17_00053747 [Ensete ventricosum]|nr:hypothetical protein GW17_00053747 [Ensete ventricosum]
MALQVEGKSSWISHRLLAETDELATEVSEASCAMAGAHVDTEIWPSVGFMVGRRWLLVKEIIAVVGMTSGKEPAAPSEELETPVESDEGGASPVHHLPRSMKHLFKTKVHKDDAGYYTLHMFDLGHQDPDKEMKARGLLHPQLARELYTLPSEVLLARATKEMVMSARAELPKKAVDSYNESAGFKEGLKRMGRVTYEYGYRVALARFYALHPDSEVEEDPFTIHPEDDLVPMKSKQAFDDSDPLES